MIMKLFLSLVLSALFYSANAQEYLFYLHGRIVEDQGANAVDNVRGFGAYQYNDIIHTFAKEKFVVMSEVRPKNTDPVTYAKKISIQIDSLLKKGVQPYKITVVGASKGGLIAMYVSSTIKNSNLNFVFMGACSEDIQLFGNILYIHEKSDDVSPACLHMNQDHDNSISHYKEIELNTGLSHGFLYKPLAVWVDPVVQWGRGNYR